jgi:hypothetical protein
MPKKPKPKPLPPKPQPPSKLNGVLQALNDAGPKPAIRETGKTYELATIKQPKLYLWKPEPDINAYELARALEVMFAGMMQGDCDVAFDNLPDGAKRHFEVRDEAP